MPTPGAAIITLFPVIAVIAAFAEFPLQVWLIVFGVNNQRWIEQASGQVLPRTPQVVYREVV